MPLKKGKSDEVISTNIKELIGAGYDREQATAIAYNEAGRSRSIRAKGKKKRKVKKRDKERLSDD